MIQKRRGVYFFAHPGVAGLRIALSTQDRQRSLAHASTDYILQEYRNALRRRFVVICLLRVYGFARFVMHNDKRSKTSFLYNKTARLSLRANKRRCKDSNIFCTHQIFSKIFVVFIVFTLITSFRMTTL